MQGADCFLALVSDLLVREHPDEKNIETILLTYPLYYSATGFITILEAISRKQKNTKHIAGVLRKWTTMEMNTNIVQIIIKAEPPLMEADDLNKLKLQLISSSSLYAPERRLRVQLRRSNIKPENPKGIFLGFKVHKVAQTLTMIDWLLFQEFQGKHLLRKSWQAKDRKIKAHGLATLADRSVQMSQWVATQILLGKTEKKQCRILSTFIKLLKRLVDIRNHESALQILCGLNMACIQRMKHLWEQISFRRQEEFNEIDEMFSPVGNYANYRELLRKNETESLPCLPYLAVFLRDITYIFDGNPELNEDGTMNLQRLLLLSSQVKRLRKYQKVPYNYEVPKVLTKFLTKLWPLMTEEELYETSLEQRPIASAEPSTFTEDELGLSLTEILHEPLLCNGLRKFLMVRNDAEYLHFIRDVDKLKSLSIVNEELIEATIEKIIHLYIDPTGQMTIGVLNINTRNELIQIHEKEQGTKTMFNEVREEIFVYIQNKHLSAFLQDPLYRSSRSVVRTLAKQQSRTISEPEQIDTVELRTNSIFGETKGLSESDWEEICHEYGLEITMDAGGTLIRQGETYNCMFRVDSGFLFGQKRATGSGGIRKTNQYPKGSIIGELNMFTIAPSPAAILAKKDSRLIRVDVASLKKYFLTYPEKGLLYYQNAGIRLGETFARLVATRSFVQAKIRRCGQKIETPTEKETVIIRFELPPTEQVLGGYTCKIVFNAITNRPGSLFITTNYLCYEYKIFGQCKREVFPVSNLRSHKIDAHKKQVTFKIRNRKKRFLLSVEDLSNCSDNLELIKKNIKRRANSQRNCRMRSLSVDTDEMELSIEDWDEIIASQAAPITFQPGDVVIEQGEESACPMTWQINIGSVRVERKVIMGDSGVNVVTNLGPGDLFGEISFLTGAKTTASIVVEEELEVYATSRDMLIQLYTTHPVIVAKFYHYLCALIAHRISELETRAQLRRASVGVTRRPSSPLLELV